MSNLQKHQPLDPQALFAQTKAGKKPSKWIRKLDPGLHKFRMFPTLTGDAAPMLCIHTHFMMSKAGKKVNFLCPAKMAGERCPACEYIEDQMGTGDPAKMAAAGEMESGPSYWANAIKRGEEEIGPRIWEYRPAVQTEMQNAYELLGRPDFTSIQDGRDFSLVRQGVQLETRWRGQFMEPSPLADTQEQIDAWMAKVTPLVKTLEQKLLSWDEIGLLVRTGEYPKRGNSLPSTFGGPSGDPPKQVEGQGFDAGGKSNF